MNQEINNIIRKIKSNRVLVVGDVILDCSIYGELSGLSAEAPITIFRESGVAYTLGGAANVALNLKNANQNVTLISVVGDDDNGKIVKSLIDKERLSTNGLITDFARKTTIKKRFFTQQKVQIFRADTEDRFEISSVTEDTILNIISECIASVDIVVLSDYLKGCLTRDLIDKIVQISHKQGIKVVIDPKDPDFTKYANCDILKPNRKELAAMVNKSELTFEDIVSGCKSICEKNHHDMLIVTLGSDGMYACDRDGKSYRFDATKTNVVDVSGAGDTAASYLTVGVASGMTVEETLTLANNAAGKKVTKNGAVPVNYKELLDLPKIIAKEQVQLLKQVLSDKMIVFTNGCFDLLHAGHIHCLQQAKQIGDVLVVGVNTDESVMRLKGNMRPIIKLEERLIALTALACVDYIIPFNDDTPIELIKELLPQILVKGSDYIDKPVVGADIVKKNGGEVKFIELYDGFSTSDIVKKIKEN